MLIDTANLDETTVRIGWRNIPIIHPLSTARICYKMIEYGSQYHKILERTEV